MGRLYHAYILEAMPSLLGKKVTSTEGSHAADNTANDA